MTTIYGLIDPLDNLLKYIGKTADLHIRMQCHIRDAKRGRRRSCNWIRSLLRASVRPRVIVIEECSGNGCNEEMFHIAIARRDGLNLFNSTDGGEGITGYKAPQSLRDHFSKIRRGVPKSDEFKAMVSRTQRGRKRPPESVEKSAVMRRGKPLPEHVMRAGVEAARIAVLGTKHSPSRRAKMSAAMKGRPSPLRGHPQSPELRAKRAAAMRSSEAVKEAARRNIAKFHDSDKFKNRKSIRDPQTGRILSTTYSSA